uniref:Uncharacterized protein n=1 Tax=Ciona savignyi TaxID=51511 RepID=H2Z7L3_CIOSA
MKYYLLDIRIHPNRFDSWAGMALARSSQIEDRLRLCESKKSHHKFSDSGTERRAMAALACFKRALSIESDSVKLWIEYGSLAYWIQSMYSRKLKRRSKSVKGDEQNIEMKQKQMINIAKNSFNSAKN